MEKPSLYVCRITCLWFILGISVISNESITTQQGTKSRQTCVLPSTLRYVYSLQSNPNTVLPHGSNVDVSTVIEVNCEEGYYDNIQQNITMVCLQTGNWSRIYSNLCAICGQVYALNKTLIVNGKESKYDAAPWHVGIYFKWNGTKKYGIRCQGTLISPNLVISAAHCFWNTKLRQKSITNLGQYKVAVGIYAIDLKKNDNEYTDFFDLKAIYLRDTYDKTNGSFVGDIAIIVLQRTVTISHVVAPVCVDWNKKYTTIPNGSFGMIFSWGDRKNNVPSTILVQKHLPFIDKKQCHTKFSNFHKYLTNDKICAGIVSGYKGILSQLDSGAGLTIKYGNAHYLTGIAVIHAISNGYSIEIMTDVSFHMDWIIQFYLNYNAD